MELRPFEQVQEWVQKLQRGEEFQRRDIPVPTARNVLGQMNCVNRVGDGVFTRTSSPMDYKYSPPDMPQRFPGPCQDCHYARPMNSCVILAEFSENRWPEILISYYDSNKWQYMPWEL